MIRLGILGSTKGTDLVPIFDAINSGELQASVEIVISNKEGSLILEKAKNNGVASVFISHINKPRESFDIEVEKNLLEKNLIILPAFPLAFFHSNAWNSSLPRYKTPFQLTFQDHIHTLSLIFPPQQIY